MVKCRVTHVCSQSVGAFSAVKSFLFAVPSLPRSPFPSVPIPLHAPLTSCSHSRRKIAPGTYTLSPEQYIPLFKSLGVTCIVRFNDKQYDRKVFTNAGIKHADMLYEDGSNPPEIILSAFLALCETEQVSCPALSLCNCPVCSALHECPYLSTMGERWRPS